MTGYEKTRRAVASSGSAVWECEQRSPSAAQDSVQASPTQADFERVRSVLRAVAPRLLVAFCASPDGTAIEVFGRAPKNVAGLLRKVRRGELVPAIRWRTPWGGIYEFCVGDIDELAGVVAAGRASS